MGDTPRVDKAIGSPGPLGEGDFVELAAIYSDVLNTARQLERQNAELLEALKALLADRWRMSGPAMHSEAEIVANAAIAKAESHAA